MLLRKVIPGHELYTIDEAGVVISQVRSKPRTLKWKVGTDGYPRVAIAGKWVQVHRLALETFTGPRPPGMVIRHGDGDAMNPCLSNLSWSTQTENLRDKRKHGTDHNVNKTHCPQGHEYDVENTYYRPDRPGSRGCRACNREAKRRKP